MLSTRFNRRLYQDKFITTYDKDGLLTGVYYIWSGKNSGPYIVQKVNYEDLLLNIAQPKAKVLTPERVNQHCLTRISIKNEARVKLHLGEASTRAEFIRFLIETNQKYAPLR